MKGRYINIMLGMVIWGMGYAQNKYADVYNQLTEWQPKIAYEKLFLYQQKDPTMANLYLQVGNLCEQILQTIDPLRENEFSSYWAENACLFYEIYPSYNHNDVRVNRKWYENLPITTQGERIKDEDVVAFQQQRLQFCKDYLSKTNLAYKHLEASKKYYNKSITLFSEINEDYQSRNDALLRTNQELLDKIDRMALWTDSSWICFQQYKELILDYPIKGYNQQLTKKPIKTFRLDGITNGDFYDEEIEVWDFVQWAEDFKKEYEQNIIPLRAEIESLYAAYKALMKGSTTIETQQRPQLDNRFLLRVGRYDRNSLVRELFLYLDKMVDLKVDVERVGESLTMDDNAFNQMMRKCYRQFILQEKAMQQLHTLQQYAREEKMASFESFFLAEFGSEKGLLNFCKEQYEWLERTTPAIMNRKVISAVENAIPQSQTKDLRFFNDVQEEYCVVTTDDTGVTIRLTDEKGYAKSVYNYPAQVLPLFVTNVENGYLIFCQTTDAANKLILSVEENYTIHTTPILTDEAWYIKAISRLSADEFAIWGQDNTHCVFAVCNQKGDVNYVKKTPLMVEK